jgi:hypothetical protein
MALNTPKTPQEHFNTSTVSHDEHEKIEKALEAKKREYDLPDTYPADFVLRTIDHFQKCGWEVTQVPGTTAGTAKLVFKDKSSGGSSSSSGGGFLGNFFGGFKR